MSQTVKNRPAVRDPGSIPGLGKFPGEGNSSLLHYSRQDSWASLVAQMIKNLPAMQETWVQLLGWEDPPEEGMTTHSSVLAWRIPMDREAYRATVCVCILSRSVMSDSLRPQGL